MQNKGVIRLFAIILGLICLYYLSFTFSAKNAEKKAAIHANGDILKEKAYLDSIKINYITNDFTYKDVKDRAMNLGLDLKGGINATLEISVREILKGLSNDSKNKEFNKALDKASEMQKNTSTPYLDLFVNAFKEISAGKIKLGHPSIFGKLGSEITRETSDQDATKILKRQVDASILTAFKVLRNRIDQFGVTQPNIQRIGSTGRILIELPGAKDIDRVKDIITRKAELQFWEVFTSQELGDFFNVANQKLATIIKPIEETIKEIDTTKTDVEKLLEGDTKDSLTVNNPLGSIFTPYPNSPYAILGVATIANKEKINEYLNRKEVRTLLPSTLKNAKFLWDNPRKNSDTIRLYAIKGNRKNEAPIHGDVIKSARQDFESFGSNPLISMTMKSGASKKWAKMTEKNLNRPVAVVLDDIVYSAPTVQGVIKGGSTQITGNFTIEEAQDVANALQSGKLPASAHIIQSEIVGPSLGQKAIDSGYKSFIIGIILILLWMLFYYGKAGIFTNITLIINMLFVFGVLAAFGAVLTLPGIAGIVLTIGMAVDANVLIYERIKEELNGGKTLKEAINTGYKGSLSSILDANITTLLTGIVLFAFGSGPVKGFATTLIIGILTSLFSAIYISRLLIEWFVNNGRTMTFNTNITKNWFKNINIDFLKKRKIAGIVSGILLILGLVSLTTQGLNYGVDFSGGRTYTIKFDKDVDPTEVATSLKGAFGTTPEVKTYGGKNQLKITTKYEVENTSKKIDSVIQSLLLTNLKSFLPKNMTYDEFKISATKNDIGLMRTEMVGPTIADDIKQAAVWAVFGSLLIVFLYILLRFRKWQFSLGAVIAVFHDVLIVLGIFSLLQKFLPFEEINQAFIAAILTVVGYSLNDTVVIFDRIREFANNHENWNYKDVVNKALSSTLGRTINTSLTTLVTLLAIFIFGGDSIKGFMFAMIIGVIVGTYSSLFIATPIMYDFIMKGKNKKLKEVE
ncbi:MAG: protein translocase subunit SecDF [Flavobacteriaceae bacterium]|nr:protein translocase subunit SecDF [Flavobacteriaceae bacterium]